MINDVFEKWLIDRGFARLFGATVMLWCKRSMSVNILVDKVIIWDNFGFSLTKIHFDGRFVVYFGDPNFFVKVEEILK